MSSQDDIKIELVNNIITGQHFIKSEYNNEYDNNEYDNNEYDNNSDNIIDNNDNNDNDNTYYIYDKQLVSEITKNKILSPHRKIYSPVKNIFIDHPTINNDNNDNNDNDDDENQFKMYKVETMHILNSDYQAVLTEINNINNNDINNDNNNNNDNNDNNNDINNNDNNNDNIDNNKKEIKLSRLEHFFHILNEKGVSIFLHIFIMACFETYFYFHYVIKLEKKMLTDRINEYLNDVYKYYINNLNDKEDKYIDFLFKNFYKDDAENYLREQYENAKEENDLLMEQLMNFCYKLIGIIFCIFSFFTLFGFIYRISVKWRWIIIENIGMFGLLGLLEYVFLQNVILKYSPFSEEEIKYTIYNEMIKIINGTYVEK